MVTLRRWTHADRGMLDGFNSPEMTAHFGGPETVEQLEVRHLRYLLPDIPGAMLVICDDEEVAVGAIGYWEHEQSTGDLTWETGWSVLPAFQRRGNARRAVDAVIPLVREDGRHDAVHAYPATSNRSSNELCRRSGFAFADEIAFPFRGTVLRCNDWVMAL